MSTVHAHPKRKERGVPDMETLLAAAAGGRIAKSAATMQSDDVSVDTTNSPDGESASAKPQRWKASIFFPVYPAHHKKDDLNELLSNPPVAMDICSYLNGGREREGNNRLYFSPIKYPPPSKDDSKERKKELDRSGASLLPELPKM